MTALINVSLLPLPPLQFKYTHTNCCGVLSDLAFFPTQDCSGDPLLISPPASVLRERPVAGCSNYAAAGITTMSYKVV
jgi:hypothetical protein